MVLNYDALTEGQELEPMTKPPISKVQLVKYAGASGDFNLLHTDDEFARKAGLEGVIAHGMLGMGFLGEYLTNLAGNNAELTRFKVRFGAMSKPGDVITCRATVGKVYEEKGARLVELELRSEKSPGQVVTSGDAVLRFR